MTDLVVETWYGGNHGVVRGAREMVTSVAFSCRSQKSELTACANLARLCLVKDVLVSIISYVVGPTRALEVAASLGLALPAATGPVLVSDGSRHGFAVPLVVIAALASSSPSPSVLRPRRSSGQKYSDDARPNSLGRRACVPRTHFTGGAWRTSALS